MDAVLRERRAVSPLGRAAVIVAYHLAQHLGHLRGVLPPQGVVDRAHHVAPLQHLLLHQRLSEEEIEHRLRVVVGHVAQVAGHHHHRVVTALHARGLPLGIGLYDLRQGYSVIILSLNSAIDFELAMLSNSRQLSTNPRSKLGLSHLSAAWSSSRAHRVRKKINIGTAVTIAPVPTSHIFFVFITGHFWVKQ